MRKQKKKVFFVKQSASPNDKAVAVAAGEIENQMLTKLRKKRINCNLTSLQQKIHFYRQKNYVTVEKKRNQSCIFNRGHSTRNFFLHKRP